MRIFEDNKIEFQLREIIDTKKSPSKPGNNLKQNNLAYQDVISREAHS
jgi:hypothetical protein